MQAFSALQDQVCQGIVHAAHIAVQVVYDAATGATVAVTAAARAKDSSCLGIPLLLNLAAVATSCAATPVSPPHTHTHPRDKLRGLPLAPGCVSVYIRHGDKHTEHKTYDDSEYEAALVHLRQVDPTLTRQVRRTTSNADGSAKKLIRKVAAYESANQTCPIVGLRV
jgi:hypothetical protein